MRDLRKKGWKVFRIWECELERKPKKVIDRIADFLKTTG